MSTQTKTIIGIFGFIAILGVFGTLFSLGIIELPKGARQQVVIPAAEQSKEKKSLDSRDAFTLARQEATRWKDDALLSNSSTLAGKTESTGRSDSWALIFTSATTKGKGFRVIIEDRMITKAEEILYVGSGAAMPDNIIPSEQAADYVRTLKGYEKENIVSVELLYDEHAKFWYWGVKTSKGVVAVKATP